MAALVPVETPAGALHGRDCIFLDSVGMRDDRLELRGELNGTLCGRPVPDTFLPYVLSFTGVLALQMVELDSWNGECVSSFDEVVGSPWIENLGGKVTPAHRHFVVQTYDLVFAVACIAFEMSMLPAQTK